MPACNWTVTECGDCLDALNLDPAIRDQVAAMAVDRLWRWTGERYGPCEVTIRPCVAECGGGVTVRCGRCLDSCSCVALSEAILPGPVQAVTEVVLDGLVLTQTAYRVDDWSRLVRIDGGLWPRCQDLEAGPTEPDTWEVTYERGEPIPPGGELIAGVLACELAKSICGDGTCRLPKRVQTVTRQGITVGFLDPFDDMDKGRTGIWEIDDWVVTHSKAVPKESSVVSPDFPRQRVTTWTAP